MSIRLSKIAKELNVGISTAVDFLHKKGHNIPSDPNHKISDKEEELLYQEFSKDKSLKIASEKISQQRQIKVKEKKESVSIEGFGEPKEEEKMIKTVVPEDQKPKFKIVGKVDLNAPKTPVNAVVEKKTPVKEVEEEPADDDYEDDTDFDDDDYEDDSQDDYEGDSNVEENELQNEKSVFSLGKPELKSKINVIGKIDLSSINQQTRPKKKTKEEKRKER